MSKYKYEEVKDYIENNSKCTLLSTTYKNGAEKLMIKCECGNIYYQNFYTLRKQNKIQCQQCAKKQADIKMRRPKEDVLKDIHTKIQDNYELIDFDYNGMSKSYLVLRHKECGYEFMRNLKSFLNYDLKCPHCETVFKIHTIDDFQKEINKHNVGFTILEGNTQRKIKIKHEECGHIFYRGFSSFKDKTMKCPHCQSTESAGSIRITERLKSNKIKYIKEYKFKDCKDKRPLPFDFYLEDFNIAIEYDGEQHEYPVSFYGGEEKFKVRQKHDKMKNDYCESNNIELIRIKYYQMKDIDNILRKKIPR